MPDKHRDDVAKNGEPLAEISRQNRIAVALWTIGLLLAFISKYVAKSMLHSLLAIIGVTLISGGFVLMVWVRKQLAYLNKSDPDPPLSLFKR